jgi:26S proteasome regulatory subunit T6
MDNLILNRTKSLCEEAPHKGMESYYKSKIKDLEMALIEKKSNLRRLEAQRNELNTLVKNLKEELYLLL